MRSRKLGALAAPGHTISRFNEAGSVRSRKPAWTSQVSSDPTSTRFNEAGSVRSRKHRWSPGMQDVVWRLQ